MLKKRFIIAGLIILGVLGYLYVDQKREVTISKNESTLANLGFSNDKIYQFLQNENPQQAAADIQKMSDLYDKITNEVGFKEPAIERSIAQSRDLEDACSDLEKYYDENKQKYQELTTKNQKLIEDNNVDFTKHEGESLLETYLRQQEALIKAEVDGVETNIEYEGQIIANKSNSLDEDYVSPQKAEKDKMQQEMIDAAKADGINLTVLSGYRSYQYQENLFAGYVEEMGHDEAAGLSAIPGTSEHQTGLAVDFGAADYTCTLEECYESTPEGKWLMENAHNYGFILRYQKGKESITGYNYEPWHYRYVGKDLATKIYKDNPKETLEEYLGIDYPIYTVKPAEQTS